MRKENELSSDVVQPACKEAIRKIGFESPNVGIELGAQVLKIIQSVKEAFANDQGEVSEYNNGMALLICNFASKDGVFNGEHGTKDFVIALTEFSKNQEIFSSGNCEQDSSSADVRSENSHSM